MCKEHYREDGQAAFAEAIAAGVLSEDRTAANWAGHYMYMYSVGSADGFKHRDTRAYVWHDHKIERVN